LVQTLPYLDSFVARPHLAYILLLLSIIMLLGGDEVKEVTLAELRGIIGKVVIDFFSPGCSVCAAIEPKLEEVEKAFASWRFFKINTVENPAVASEHSVFTVPTIIVQVDGREQKRWSKYFSIDEVGEYLQEIDKTES